MKPGVRFIDENPEFKGFFEQLFLKRELDQWYLKTCKQQLEIPEGLKKIVPVTNLTIRDNFNPSVDLYFDLNERTGDGGFIFKQQIQLTISKIIRVFKLNILYSVQHESLGGEIQTFGTNQETVEMLSITKEIIEILEGIGYIELHGAYDLSDTIFEWNQLDMTPFDRRLTLDYAAFYDALELCNEAALK